MLMQMDVDSHRLSRKFALVRGAVLRMTGPLLRLLASFFSAQIVYLFAFCSCRGWRAHSAAEALQTLDFKQLEATSFLSRKFFRLGRFIR